MLYLNTENKMMRQGNLSMPNLTGPGYEFVIDRYLSNINFPTFEHYLKIGLNGISFYSEVVIDRCCSIIII